MKRNYLLIFLAFLLFVGFSNASATLYSEDFTGGTGFPINNSDPWFIFSGDSTGSVQTYTGWAGGEALQATGGVIGGESPNQWLNFVYGIRVNNEYVRSFQADMLIPGVLDEFGNEVPDKLNQGTAIELQYYTKDATPENYQFRLSYDGGGLYATGFSNMGSLFSQYLQPSVFNQFDTYKIEFDQANGKIKWYLNGSQLWAYDFSLASSAWASEAYTHAWTYDLGDGINSWFDNININTQAPIPEPTTMLLLGTGLIGLAGLRRKLKK